MFRLIVAATLALVGAQRTYDEAVKIIQSNVRGYEATVDPCTSTNCCKMSSSSCSVSSFPKHATTLVYPGGDTRCIYSYSTAFSFQVIPADTDKVLIYFQGGGACWDQSSTALHFCSTDAEPSSLVGLFDQTKTNNAYKSYTVVQVLYCSGDLHAGNVTRPYTDRTGKPIVQSGIANTNSVLNWIKAQQSSGALAATLTDLVVMGCSAGSIGAQIWAETILKTFNWKHAAVIPDSYAGIFPDGTQGPLIRDYGACQMVDPALKSSCDAGTLTLQDVTALAMSHIAEFSTHVPFSFIQSKADSVQISFYIAIGASDPDVPANITPEQFYSEVNKVFERYNTNANFVNYMVEGNQHCFTNLGLYYSADTTGPSGNPSAGQQAMTAWVEEMPLVPGTPVTTDCYGTSLTQANWYGTSYCAAELQGKSYSA